MANDEELCKSLIEQNEDMDTGCADSAENSSVHSNQSDGEDVFSAALHKLEALACENGFTVHEVPYDGNCIFRAVSHQLQTTGVCTVDSSRLRQMVADYLEEMQLRTAMLCLSL